MSLFLPFEEWPAADQALWLGLMRAGGPLDDRGPLSPLRETSRRSLAVGYGRWLAWVTAHDAAALELAPADRLTMDRLRAWLDDLSHLRPMTQLTFLARVLRVLTCAAPERDWRQHQRVHAHLKRRAGRGDPSRKQGRVLSTDILVQAGIRHATIDADAATTELERMKRRRNGTMVALLALIPIRRRAFVRLEIGSCILLYGDHIVLSLEGELTKNGRPWQCWVPNLAVDLLRSYIDEVRPWFLQRGHASHRLLWVGDRGQPFQDDHFGVKIAKITTRLTGVRVSPHLFRDAAATTLSRLSPDAANLIRPVLAHTSDRTAERHYIQANSIEAGRNYAELVRRKKRKSA